jgi:hypothetical protein
LQQRWESVIQDLKDRKKALTAAYLKEGQARPVGLRDGLLTVAFSQEQDFYVKEIDKPQHKEALGEVLEERLGTRPRLEFRVTDGAPEVPGATAGEAGGTEPEGSRIIAETRAETATVPERIEEGEPPRGQASRTNPAPEPEATDAPDRAGKADDVVQSQLEVFEMARERFGGPGGIPGSE